MSTQIRRQASKRGHGQALIEYVVLVALVIVMVIASLSIFGGALTDMFSHINSDVTTSVNAPDSPRYSGPTLAPAPRDTDGAQNGGGWSN